MTAILEVAWREAVSLQRQNRVEDAIAAYQRLLAHWPRHGEGWFNLAVLQRQVRRFGDALASYQKALESGVARPEEVHLNRSVIYTDYLGQHAQAERELHLALLLNPRFSPALLNLANLFEDFGRRPEARATYARILAIGPHFEALARYANLQSAIPDPLLVGQLTDALADPTATLAERASLGFALGRLLDAAGQYPAAFAAYEAANHASRASAGPQVAAYDRARQHAFTDRLIACEAQARAAQAAASRPLERRPRPLFICGMFRSGSTLTEQLLAACPGVAASGELDFLPRLVAGELAPFPDTLTTLSPARLREIAERYCAELTKVSQSAAYVTDKRPDNFLYIGLIKRLFPEAKIVHTIRNPLDNCLSIFFLHLDQQLSYALDLMDIGHYFREYRRLMAHWKTLFADDIFDFDYDALVSDPQSTLQGLGAFLGLELPDFAPTAPVSTAAPARAIKTASVWQVREPLYRTSSGRARHYARELEHLRVALSDLS